MSAPGIRIGLIGYGYWGPNLARNFNETPGACIAAISDLSKDRLALAKARYPNAEVTTEHDRVLGDPKIDAVIIATPVTTHYPLVKRALENGKHVLVTKPITSKVSEGSELCNLAEKKGLVLMVDHTFIFTGAVKKIKQLVEDGSVGPLYYYDSVRINLGLFQHDVNVLWDLAVHDLSIMQYLHGALPNEVSATGISHFAKQPENVAYLTCFFSDNFIAHLHVNWLAPVKIRRTLIGGERQMIVYDDLEPDEKVKIYDKGVDVKTREGAYQLLVSYRAGDMRAPQLDRKEALAVEAAHFVECINKKAKPITDAPSAVGLVGILEAANESLKGGGRPVKVQQVL
ncbi:MAG TPA: Gfo/Idh/MocA family oxidoreductase [Planctomycetota bacterium]|nr:Gfo/Idh/MocA family oxidoreductase [Planctomycetota bacterium]